VNVTPDRFAAYFTAFSRGRLVPGGAKALRAQLVDLYDHGVFRADAHLGRALELLESAGRLGRGARLVVTADHGENLIEHGLVRHSLVYEANVRVPLLYWQVGLEEHPALEEPVSAIVAHTLLLEGKPPRPLPPVHSVSVPSPKNRAGEATAPAVAAWSEDDKVLFSGGTCGVSTSSGILTSWIRSRCETTTRGVARSWRCTRSSTRRPASHRERAIS
jgi:hypothetical protein